MALDEQVWDGVRGEEEGGAETNNSASDYEEWCGSDLDGGFGHDV